MLASFGESGVVNTDDEQVARATMHVSTTFAALRYTATSSMQPVFDTMTQLLAAAMAHVTRDHVKSARTTSKKSASTPHENSESATVDTGFVDAILEVMTSDLCDAAMCNIATSDIATNLSIISDMVLRAVQHGIALPNTTSEISRQLSIIVDSLDAADAAAVFTFRSAYRNIFDNTMAIIECDPPTEEASGTLRNVFGNLLGFVLRGSAEQKQLSSELANRAVNMVVSNMVYETGDMNNENSNSASCYITLPIAKLFADVLMKKANFSEPFAKYVIELLRSRVMSNDALEVDKASATLAFFRSHSKLKAKALLMDACRSFSDELQRRAAETPKSVVKDKGSTSLQRVNRPDFASVSLSLLA